MASYNLRTLMAYLQGTGANTTATLQQHCYAAMPGVTAKQCSPARALYRANGHGANATGHSRYPAQPGKVYATQLGAAQQATGGKLTAKQAAQARSRVGKVWAKQAAQRTAGKQAKRNSAQPRKAATGNSAQPQANSAQPAPVPSAGA